MEKRNYYCLISGLPDIVLEQSKAPFSLAELLEELRTTLHPEDFSLVELLFLPRDNRNLLALSRKSEAPWEPMGKYSRAEMEEKLKEPGQLPAYMDQFYRAFRQEEPLYPTMSWENQLTRLYYDYVLTHTKGFLHEWFSFEKHLNNVLAAWNAREYDYDMSGQLIGEDDITGALRKSHARDFGLARDLEFVDKLMSALEIDDLLERERAVDRIRWHHIDELNTFHYFTVETVLGYLLQFLLLHRWLQLDRSNGERLIQQQIEVMEDRVEFSKV